MTTSELLNSASALWVNSGWLLLLLLSLALLATAWAAGIWKNRRRSRSMLRVLGNSTRGQVTIRSQSVSGSFSATIEPPPEPFVQFTLLTRMASPLNPAGSLASLAGFASGDLAISGRFQMKPAAELIWRRDRAPGRALTTVGESQTLWTRRRLDVTRSEYVVRGRNTHAIEHAFAELQRRYSPMLYRVDVQADGEEFLELRLSLTGLNDEQLPALVTLIRALGRAALQD